MRQIYIVLIYSNEIQPSTSEFSNEFSHIGLRGDKKSRKQSSNILHLPHEARLLVTICLMWIEVGQNLLSTNPSEQPKLHIFQIILLKILCN